MNKKTQPIYYTCCAYILWVVVLKKLYYVTIPVIICALIFCFTCKFVGGETVMTSANASENLPTIILDAGHGGFDGGALSSDGLVEKDINLKITLYLNEYLNLFGFDTVLTRDKDESLESDGFDTVKQKKTSDIHNRMALMDKTDNALFVSIHQNHYSVEKYHGLQVFYSPTFSEESSKLAQSIQETVTELIQNDNERQIKKCGTSVFLLYNAVKPAVLVECGFLSNHNEAHLLNTDGYQKKIAFCIALGIQDYVFDKE